MLIFFLLYFSIYGLMNYYACTCLFRLVLVSSPLQTGLMFFSFIMILSPFAIRVLDRYGFSGMAQGLSYPVFYWMGFIVLFDSAFLIYDFFQFLTGRRIPLCFRYIPFVYALLAMIYGSYEAKNIRLKTVNIFSKNLTDKNRVLKIIQISDLHLGMMSDPETVRKIIDLIRKNSPDLLISTGDFIDHCRGFDFTLLNDFADLSVPMGKYAILGNHEHYAGLTEAKLLTEKAGFKILLNETVQINNSIKLTGVQDGIILKNALKDPFLADELRKKKDTAFFSVFLNHRPETEISILRHYDLLLSGHTHQGQIFPFNFVTWMFFPFKAGQLLTIEGGMLYVSAGTGTWGPPIRFLAPPEVTCFNLLPVLAE